MSLEFNRALDDLFVKRVLYVVGNCHDNGFVHLVADYGTDKVLRKFLSLIDYTSVLVAAAFISLSRRIVIMRAMSFLTALIRMGFSSWFYGKLETQAEKFVFKVCKLVVELVNGFFLSVHLPSQLLTTVLFFTNLHLMGSLWEASLRASLACASSMPPISNITLPGLTTATQYSGEPLPEPIRVSAGFR